MKRAENHRAIALLLSWGSTLSTLLIAAGIALTLWPLAPLPLSGSDIVRAGILVLILLPVARVVLMLIGFIRQRDGLYALIAALVLMIIAAGAWLG
ncbi:DUF1634 domain-containing protein [Jejubacter calystegiae]|uniref:DUF1634 domain-containing protein n=1 Tax=Jejubacter calystegiae TaxID=2579935 RepID=A0A4P8YIF4_9ENTR|nr:DUF1634 domain-containing protein [Jejubacter calystegiae]QCT20390.1 DUF1634 domain-containing protein [Jejubacter calystegiae]